MEPAHAMDGPGRRMAVLTVLILIAASVAALGFARPALALRAPVTGGKTARTEPMSPTAVPNAGASINGMTEYEAASATTNVTSAIAPWASRPSPS